MGEITQRMQDVIVSWQGAQRGQSLHDLHAACQAICEQKDEALLPKRLLLIPELDRTALEHELHRPLSFTVPPKGRFDTALVPVGKQGKLPDHFWLAVEANHTLTDQIALYGHAVGHLLLNHREKLAGRKPTLHPIKGETHVDRLAELRYIDTLKDVIDRRVLSTFAKLTALIEAPEESSYQFTRATQNLRERLRARDWQEKKNLHLHHTYTAGRILPGSTKRGKRQSVDALLRISTIAAPLAVVHVQRENETREQAIARVISSAQHLWVPYGFLLQPEDEQDILELDLTEQTRWQQIQQLPSPNELFDRWLKVLHLDGDERAKWILEYPYNTKKRTPRYYQEAAINTAVVAVLQARRGLREKKRVLLTLATGTGKTQIAFQILWKLRQRNEVKNVLFLADRTYLLQQAKSNDFAEFGDALEIASGETKTSRHITLASYQWMTSALDDMAHFQELPRDYFDVIIVDECHRGSANETSAWRQVLEYFDDAVQIGLTATPLSTRDVKTKDYFDDAVYTYSLSRGINDGFLAPYSVHRVKIGSVPQEDETEPEEQDVDATQHTLPEQELPTTQAPGEPTASEATGEPAESAAQEPTQELDEKIVTETANAMRGYTQTIANHLASHFSKATNRGKTIVFCVDNNHALAMRNALIVACSEWARPGDIERIVVDDGNEGKRALDAFCDPEKRQPLIVTTAKLLSTGIDAPTCKYIVLARGVGSLVEFKQIIGRGTRLFTPDKSWFTIIDYAGAIKHFFEPNFDGDPEVIQVQDLEPAAEQSPTSSQSDEYTSLVKDATGTYSGENTPISPHSAGQPEGSEADTTTIDATDLTGNGHNTPTVAHATHQSTAADDRIATEPIPSLCNCTAPPQAKPPHQASTPSAPAQESIDLGSAEAATRVDGDTTWSDTTNEPPPITRGETPDPANSTQQEKVVKIRSNGNRLVIKGETIFELGPDGKTLRTGTPIKHARQTLTKLIPTPDALAHQWIILEYRRAIIDQLETEQAPLDRLTREMNLPDSDPYDLLRLLAFAIPPLTRAERVERLKSQHADFFARYSQNILATNVLNGILDRYIHGTIEDVGDTTITNLPAFQREVGGSQLQMAQSFWYADQRPALKAVLEEVRRLLYAV